MVFGRRQWSLKAPSRAYRPITANSIAMVNMIDPDFVGWIEGEQFIKSEAPGYMPAFPQGCWIPALYENKGITF